MAQMPWVLFEECKRIELVGKTILGTCPCCVHQGLILSGQMVLNS